MKPRYPPAPVIARVSTWLSRSANASSKGRPAAGGGESIRARIVAGDSSITMGRSAASASTTASTTRYPWRRISSGVVCRGWFTCAILCNTVLSIAKRRSSGHSRANGRNSMTVSRVPKTTAAGRVTHLSLDERTARGKAARADVPRRVTPSGSRTGPARPGRDAGGAGDHARRRSWSRSATGGCSCRRSRSTAAPPPDGRRPRRRAAHRAARAALRRRAPLELRRVRRARPAAGVRHQRLRRDAAGPVRVGRQAARRQLRRRRPRPRLRRQAAARRQPAPSAAPTARRCGEFAAMRDARPLVRAPRRRGARRAGSRTVEPQAASSGSTRNVAKARAKDSLRAFAQADRDRRRRAADRQRPAADRADRGASPTG